MNKSDLVHHVADKARITQAEAQRAVDAIFNTNHGAIVSELQNGGEVNITGFGKFSRGYRESREGRNPQTGEAMTYPASNTAKFRAGKGLKDAVR
jgi:DNA-binding protein HU-beta